ncbi:hypothetical protein BJP36_04260 [Moorena producens JHB]|uniref:SMP-30/Gluconolactonase/LRE-like region domain-containing protein n=1 Tax=Moorena producens (strain JHB) TaxID=1454205 RepID=A0A1D9FV45_MOOP1|nr:hypothetical protein [Moorena producens]AOY79246.1 hypothetical protein BJP36_04260 [Moorena producens JHB]
MKYPIRTIVSRIWESSQQSLTRKFFIILISASLTILWGTSIAAQQPPIFGKIAFQGTPLIEFQDTGVSTRIHPTKMAIGQGKIYFNSSAAVVYRIDEKGVLENVSILPNAGGIPDDDFTIGITFDKLGNLYVSNNTGIYLIRKRDLGGKLPAPNTKIADLPADLQFAMGLVADNKGNLYLSDIFGGSIYKIDIATGKA